MENQKSSSTPKWLEELQLKSWEPEILLSGIVLYGMFKTPELLDQFLGFVQTNINISYSDIENMISLMKVATYWLIFGLILHLISRGIWIGMVGLSYTFPKGINHEKLKFKGRFSKRLEEMNSTELIIIRLERLCSSLFSVSFMLFMCIVGGYLYLLAFIMLPFILNYYLLDGASNPLIDDFFGYYALVAVVIGLIGLIDFLTLGIFKKIKFIEKVYWPIYRVISFVTLSRFYRHIYYNIISNYSKWKISMFLFVFTIVSIFSIISSSDSTYPGDTYSSIEIWSNSKGTGAFTGYYDDQNEDKYSVQAHIQSDIISGNTIRLFVVASANREDSMRAHVKYDSIIKVNPDTSRSYLKLNTVKSFFHVYLNDSLQENLNWKFHYKSITRQKGYLTYLDITDLPIGQHTLKVKAPPGMRMGTFADIPFYRELGYQRAPVKSRKEEPEDYADIKPLLTK